MVKVSFEEKALRPLKKVDFLGCMYITPCLCKKELMMLMIIKMIIKLQKLWAKNLYRPPRSSTQEAGGALPYLV